MIARLAALTLVNTAFRGTRFFRLKAALLRSVGHVIGDDTKIVGPLRMSASSTLAIGSQTWIGANFTWHGNGSVAIGDMCDIAPDVTFLTGTHDIGGPERRAGEGRHTAVTVGDGSWVGARSTLVGDVTVGTSAVVAAASLVVKPVAANTMVGGVPAHEIKVL